MEMDFDKLKNRLDEINKSLTSPRNIPLDPLRGLKGELERKMLAGLAGHRSGVLSEEESSQIDKIQAKYDIKNSK